MPLTVNVNKLSLCHKGSNGMVMQTIPDVCKTPSPGGPVPVPYPNIAFSKDLAKGTKKVKADGGQMIANKGSEFSISTGDEPGTVGGVKSSVTKNKATWITWSPNVKMEGKNACRLTDKMFLNKMNTVSMGGLLQRFLSPNEIIEFLCEIICECMAQGRGQECLEEKIEEEAYDGDYPDEDSRVWREVSMQEGENGWEIIRNRAGDAPTSNRFTPRGGIRPDIVIVDAAGNPTNIVEVKFPGDGPRASQDPLDPDSLYNQAADDLDADYDYIDMNQENDYCTCGPPPSGSPETVDAPAPAPEEEEGGSWVPWAIGGAALALGVVACIASVACAAAVAGAGAAAKATAAGLGGALILGTAAGT